MKHNVYICNNCRFMQYHPMNYCPKCPGKLKLVNQDIEVPQNFTFSKDMQKVCQDNKLEYFEEYAKFDEKGHWIPSRHELRKEPIK